ncbi:MAG: hypothetical protein U5L95_01220 [Candidatus Saccharibacteria bacterium]|nr:hypothetical protein [Candidatus Saccharibacteria bacterium]
MPDLSQPQYFIAQAESMEGLRLSVYYAPHSENFIVPQEVLRAESADTLASGALWKLLTGKLTPNQDDPETTIEPSTPEDVKARLDSFLRTQPADEIFVDENAPEGIKEALESVQTALASEAQTMLGEMLGLKLPPPVEDDDRPYPGQYL